MKKVIHNMNVLYEIFIPFCRKETYPETFLTDTYMII